MDSLKPSRDVAVLSSLKEFAIAVVDPSNGSQLASFKGNPPKPGTLSFVGTDYIVAAQEKGSGLNIWKWGSEQPLYKCHSPEPIQSLTVSDDGAFCVGGSARGRLFLWVIATGILAKTWDAHYKAISALRVSYDGCRIYSGSEDAMVLCWSILEALTSQSGNQIMERSVGMTSKWSNNEHTLKITDIVMDETGERLFTSSMDRTVKICESSSGKVILSIACPSPIRAVCCDLLENFLFMGGENSIIYKLDLSAAAITETSSKAKIISLNNKPSDLESSTLFDPKNGKGHQHLQELRGHTKAITAIERLSDASSIVSSSEDGTMRTWHMASRQCLLMHNLGLGGQSKVSILQMPATMFFSQGYKPKSVLPIAPFKGSYVHKGEGQLLDSDVAITFSYSNDAYERRQRIKRRQGSTNFSPFTGNMEISPHLPAHEANVSELIMSNQNLEQKIFELESEMQRLKNENSRWSEVNNALLKKMKS